MTSDANAWDELDRDPEMQRLGRAYDEYEALYERWAGRHGLHPDPLEIREASRELVEMQLRFEAEARRLNAEIETTPWWRSPATLVGVGWVAATFSVAAAAMWWRSRRVLRSGDIEMIYPDEEVL